MMQEADVNTGELQCGNRTDGGFHEEKGRVYKKRLLYR